MVRCRGVGAWILVGMLGLAACGGPASRGPGPGQAGREIRLREKEWAIEPKNATVAGGKVRITVVNEGAVEHNFVIERLVSIEHIQPGETRTVEVTLAPGTYQVLCTLPGHREAGMSSQLKVD